MINYRFYARNSRRFLGLYHDNNNFNTVWFNNQTGDLEIYCPATEQVKFHPIADLTFNQLLLYFTDDIYVKYKENKLVITTESSYDNRSLKIVLDDVVKTATRLDSGRCSDDFYNLPSATDHVVSNISIRANYFRQKIRFDKNEPSSYSRLERHEQYAIYMQGNKSRLFKVGNPMEFIKQLPGTHVAAFSNDWLITGKQKTIIIYKDFEKHSQIDTGIKGVILSVCFSPDQLTFAVAAEEEVQIWDLDV